MKILLNPSEGAPVSDVQVAGQILFKDKPFETESVVKIEDDKVADTILSLFEFLQEVSAETAKNFIEKKKAAKFKCDKCDYASDDEKKLQGHSLHHAKEAKIDAELGIPVIGISAREELSPDEKAKKADEFEKQDLARAGISGGWEDDSPMKGKAM